MRAVGHVTDHVSMLAREGCIVNGRAVSWEKLHPESSHGRIFFGKRTRHNRFV
jgi:hypothetical protein